MKVNVDNSMCIGCGACVGTCPEVFEISDEGYAVVKEGVTEEQLSEAKNAANGCPVSAITVEE